MKTKRGLMLMTSRNRLLNQVSVKVFLYIQNLQCRDIMQRLASGLDKHIY